MDVAVAVDVAVVVTALNVTNFARVFRGGFFTCSRGASVITDSSIILVTYKFLSNSGGRSLTSRTKTTTLVSTSLRLSEATTVSSYYIVTKRKEKKRNNKQNKIKIK